MTEQPSNGELHRLYESMREDTRRGFADLNARLDRMPTSELLMAHLQGWQQQLNSTRDEVASLRAHVDMSDAELGDQIKAERVDREAQRKADLDGRRWFVGVVAIPIILSLLALAAALGVIG